MSPRDFQHSFDLSIKFFNSTGLAEKKESIPVFLINTNMFFNY